MLKRPGAGTPELAVCGPTAMTTNESADKERIDTRDLRALTEYLTVLDDVGRVRGADGLYLVVSQSGSEYLVDTLEGACECPDAQYRGVECKHRRRVAFPTIESHVLRYKSTYCSSHSRRSRIRRLPSSVMA